MIPSNWYLLMKSSEAWLPLLEKKEEDEVEVEEVVAWRVVTAVVDTDER